MTYGRWRLVCANGDVSQAAVSHSAELVRGKCLASELEGPLIRPSGPFSPRGEGAPLMPTQVGQGRWL
jgi:hypothetical protein